MESAAKKKVLVVEDEPSIADAVEFVLQKEGFKVERAGFLQEARKVLAADTFDFIILDIGLPDGNGLDFCKEIRQSSQVPLLFLTARDEEIDRILGLELGADDYVSKPFSARELAARVKVILRRAQQGVLNPGDVEEKEPLQFGKYLLNKQKMMLYFEAEEILLTPNEWNLIEFLLKHQGRVFSRRQLMEACWEEPDSALERTVDAHIKTLRKKIGDTSGIKTHRGFGYSLDLEEQ